MRTTLTLDSDVEQKLRAEMRRSGKSFKEIVNEFLRRGLHSARNVGTSERFVVHARKMGVRPGLAYENPGELLEQLEGPAHR